MSEPTVTHIASFGARAMALTIDFALLAVTQVFLFVLPASLLLDKVIHLDLLSILTVYTSYFVVFCASFVLLHMVYFILFHAWSGQTIGKMVMGIRVVSTENKEVSPAVAFLRWTGYILSFIPLATGFLWSAVDKDRCSWHDRLAQTRVVSAEMT